MIEQTGNEERCENERKIEENIKSFTYTFTPGMQSTDILVHDVYVTESEGFCRLQK